MHGDLTPVTAITDTKQSDFKRTKWIAVHFQTTLYRIHAVSLLPVLTEIQPNFFLSKNYFSLWSKPYDKLYIKTLGLKNMFLFLLKISNLIAIKSTSASHIYRGTKLIKSKKILDAFNSIWQTSNLKIFIKKCTQIKAFRIKWELIHC